MAQNSPLAILSSLPSDAHVWNLIYLELLLQEQGYTVINLGNCLPHQDLFDAIEYHYPDVVVISSVNGNLYQEGLELMMAIKENNLTLWSRFVIGGKPGDKYGKKFMHKKLIQQGYDAVFIQNESKESFIRYLNSPKDLTRSYTVAF